jgi:hypothetical protein
MAKSIAKSKANSSPRRPKKSGSRRRSSKKSGSRRRSSKKSGSRRRSSKKSGSSSLKKFGATSSPLQALIYNFIDFLIAFSYSSKIGTELNDVMAKHKADILGSMYALLKYNWSFKQNMHRHPDIDYEGIYKKVETDFNKDDVLEGIRKTTAYIPKKYKQPDTTYVYAVFKVWYPPKSPTQPWSVRCKGMENTCKSTPTTLIGDDWCDVPEWDVFHDSTSDSCIQKSDVYAMFLASDDKIKHPISRRFFTPAEVADVLETLGRQGELKTMTNSKYNNLIAHYGQRVADVYKKYTHH